MADFQIHVIVG